MVALGITAFTYGFRTKYSGRLKWLLGFFRFLTLFLLFVLLINPKFRNVTYTKEKPKLPIVVDNSESIAVLADTSTVKAQLDALRNNEALNERFDLELYTIGTDFGSLDTLSFHAKQSRLDQAFTSLDDLFEPNRAPTVFLTDGNQTYGRDYEFVGQQYQNAVYPVILGDTTQYMDLKISQLNTNRYSFLKNQFPVEAVVVYNGTDPVQSRFLVRNQGTTVYAQNLTFDETQNSQTLSFTLPSTQVGVQRYSAEIAPLGDEKNTSNNRKLFAVEVIDQATKILIVSDFIHPDIGALKKSIETNEQRTVTVVKPLEAVSSYQDYQLLLLYQPTRNFASLFQKFSNSRVNTFLITGTHTDWNFLNAAQKLVRKEALLANEEVEAHMNLNYGSYAIEDIGLDDYPPLRTRFGELEVLVPGETLLYQEIDDILTGSPMLATTDLNGLKTGIWDGEGLWKWRAHSYLQTESFMTFDGFMGKIVQYLASNKRRSRLEVQHESFYYNNNPISISAQYFDNNYVFDNRAQLQIRVIHQETNKETVIPMLLKNNFYEVDLNTLDPGAYAFTVSVIGENMSRSGNFSILEYDVERQFLNADVTKLQRLATNTGGTIFLLNDVNSLIDNLLGNETYKPIQRSQRKTVPLIDWKYLLALIVLSLACEWFIRKYNGLI